MWHSYNAGWQDVTTSGAIVATLDCIISSQTHCKLSVYDTAFKSPCTEDTKYDEIK